MILGFNHNIMYKGDIFHVQTEDSGVEIPNIVTLLYRGGVILGSMKTSYADILKIDNLEDVVEELMKEQHKTMMRRLKAGEFDDRAFPSESGADGENSGAPPTSPETGEDVAPPPEQEPSAENEEATPAERPSGEEQGESAGNRSLNDEILRFFGIQDT